jgi:hypothetical protein
MHTRLPFDLIGAVLLLSTFSYEPIERRLQSYFEDLWIKLEDQSLAASGRHASFIRSLAAAVGRVLDRLFGPTTVSWQAIAVSVLLALAAYDLNYGFGRPPSTTLRWQALAILALASLPLIHRRLVVITIGALLAVLAPMMVSAFRLVLSLSEGGKVLILDWLLWVGAILLSFASALFVLWCERRLIRWLSDGPSLVRAVTTVLGCIAAIGLVVVVPMLLSDVARPARRDVTQSQRASVAVGPSVTGWVRMDTVRFAQMMDGSVRVETKRQTLRGQGLTMQIRQPPLSRTLMDLAAMNVFTTLPLLLLLIGATSFAIHRVLWEIVLRPIYEVQRTGYRTAARAIGVACLLYGLGIADSLVGALLGH